MVHRRRVVIVDDSRTIQALLEQILSARLGYEIVGIAGDGDCALSMIYRLRPDLVTIDLELPHVDGRQLLRQLDGLPDTHRVVISGNACNLDLKSSLKSIGADECFCKADISRDPAAFCRALAAVMRDPRKVSSRSSGSKDLMESAITGYPVPADEQQRRAALVTLDLANDHADYRLDLLTDHLAKTTSFPACVMTFIDRETQWIKAASGLDRGSMARSQAICNYTICADEPFIVPDTIADMRFNKLDVVRGGPMIRSYVGSPIIGSSGIRLGAICLLDTKPRHVTPKELTNLQSIARIAAAWIEDRAAPMDHAA